jgi:hypothetical protein
MDAPDGYAVFWRSGMKRLIVPWERRHLRFFACGRLVGGIVSGVCGVLVLSFGGSDRKAYGWAAFFLANAAANIAGGYWQITVARSVPPRT